MNKFAQGAVTLTVAAAIFFGLQALKEAAANREPTAEELGEEFDEMQARAEQAHPDMAKTDALKQLATDESAKTFATLTGTQQAQTAAGMFWGFYWVNTKARVDYCDQRGVDISPFTVEFERSHAAELSRASAIYSAAGENPLEHLPKVLPQLAKAVEQDMIDVTAGAQVPLDQACELFNENAEELVERIQMPPHVKRALLAG